MIRRWLAIAAAFAIGLGALLAFLVAMTVLHHMRGGR